jgi:hypothetical protein
VSTVIGDRFKDKILESAKFYAMINHALANAGQLEYKTKYAVSKID